MKKPYSLDQQNPLPCMIKCNNQNERAILARGALFTVRSSEGQGQAVFAGVDTSL